MSNWTEISSLATGGGTLVLALATFASVRSSNRSARLAELALQQQRRPIFAPSRLEDPMQKIGFVDRHWVHVEGGHAVAEHVDGVVYLVVSLRNVGAGIGVCQGWFVSPGMTISSEMPDHRELDQFRMQSRDLYIPAGDVGLWQGALRDQDDPTHGAIADTIARREWISLELLYSDQVGGQRTVTRFGLSPAQDESWFATVNRHWHLDQAGPR